MNRVAAVYVWGIVSLAVLGVGASVFFLDPAVAELLSVVARVAVGVTLIVAGGAKLVQPDFFAHSIRQLSLTWLLGSLVARGRLIAHVLGTIEIAAGAAFALGLGLAFGGAVVLGLLALFSLTLTVALVRGRRASCGCFGLKRIREIEWLDLGRNALLAALTVAGIRSAELSLDHLVPRHYGLFLLTLAMSASFFHVWLQRLRLRPVAVASRDMGPHVLFVAATGGGTGGHYGGTRRDSDGEGMNVRALKRRYASVAALEGRAAAATVELDRHKLTALDRETVGRENRWPRHAAAARREHWLSRERALLELDRELGKELQALYKAAAEEAKATPEGNATLVRVALLHWVVLLRRRAMEAFHTRVAGLARDPDCAGDVIGDGLLQRYFDALFRERDDLRREIENGRFSTHVQAMQALAEIARQSACLGEQQSATLASHLYWSFVELSGYLRLNGLAHIVPYAVQAASAPMLLFYDVEKYRGSDSPLARWFSQHYGTLAEGVATRRLPSCWHGLWLYDWRSGHLVGYRVTANQRDENDVDGVVFLRSITQRENLGNYGCSFSEMIERSPGSNGYVCAGSTCGPEQPATSPPTNIGKLISLLGSGLVKGFGVQSGQRGRQPGQVTSSTVCNEGTDGKARGDAPTNCGGGLEVAGRTRESSAVRCLSEQVMSPTERLLMCYGEQTGRCADPIGSLAKDLAGTAYVGVKLGDGCSLKETADGAADGGAAEGDEAAADKQQAQDDLDEAIEDLEKKDEVWQDARVEWNQAEVEQNEADEKLDATPGNSPDYEKNFADWEAAVEKKMQAQERAESALHDRDNAYNKAVEAWEKLHRLNNARCPPDTPDCGGNGCSAMSEAARKTMECFQQAVEPTSNELQAPWGPNADPVVDPSPDEPGAISIPCFEAILAPDAAPAGRAAQACWAVDCGPDYETVGDPLRGCQCRPRDGAGAPDGGLQGNCADVDCAQGRAVLRGGRCECSGDAMTGVFGGDLTGGGLPGPVGSFVVGPPVPFSATQEEHFGPDWPRV